MKIKNKILSSLVGVLLLSSSLYSSSIEEESFNEWIVENTRYTQAVGIGYNEEGLGVTYGVNTDFSFYGTEKTNFYTFVELSNNRIELLGGYDIVQNYGFKGFQIIPEIGVSVDTSSGGVGTLVAIKARYNIADDLGFSFGVKNFLSKPIKDSGDTTTTKTYLFSYITYQF